MSKNICTANIIWFLLELKELLSLVWITRNILYTQVTWTSFGLLVGYKEHAIFKIYWCWHHNILEY